MESSTISSDVFQFDGDGALSLQGDKDNGIINYNEKLISGNGDTQYIF